jgi:DNA helicase-2/ATP-dependent DNA helicase PcrA
MIQSFQVITKNQSAYEAALHIAQHSGLLKDLYEDKSVEGLNRYENIQELLNGIKEFSNGKILRKKALTCFMQDVALLTNDDKDKDKRCRYGIADDHPLLKRAWSFRRCMW